MQTIEILVQEHELILKMIDNLACARDLLEQGNRIPGEFFEKAIVFARDFADRFHHFKEEFLLFGLLTQKKADTFDTEIEALRYEHERGRKCINQIDASLAEYTRGEEIATVQLLENLAAYISILRRHIYSENRIFSKMVMQELSEHEDQLLAQRFRQDGETVGGRDLYGSSCKLVAIMAKTITDQKC
jgi:hemerythrin-like domain-containing protein